MFDPVLTKRLLCVALIAAIMVPFGNVLYPYMSAGMSGTQFTVLEAVVTTALGYGIAALLG